MLTQSAVQAALVYDQHSGQFTRLSGPYKGNRAGWRMTDGYIALYLFGKQHYAHRLAWFYVNGQMPEMCIDHINGDRSDNRISNLRSVDYQINGQNLRAAHRDNKTGLLGVSFNKKEQKFIGQLTTGGHPKWMQRFDTAEAASAAYLEEKRRRHAGCTI